MLKSNLVVVVVISVIRMVEVESINSEIDLNMSALTSAAWERNLWKQT
jgi:hypothetical protein